MNWEEKNKEYLEWMKQNNVCAYLRQLDFSKAIDCQYLSINNKYRATNRANLSYNWLTINLVFNGHGQRLCYLTNEKLELIPKIMQGQ